MFWNRPRAQRAQTTTSRTPTGRGNAMVFQPAHLRAPKERLRAPQRIIKGVPIIATHAGMDYPIPPARMLTAAQQEMSQGPGSFLYSQGIAGLGEGEFYKSPWVLGAVGIAAAVAGIYFLQKGMSA